MVEVLLALGFVQTWHDAACLAFRVSGVLIAIIALHVDDMLGTGDKFFKLKLVWRHEALGFLTTRERCDTAWVAMLALDTCQLLSMVTFTRQLLVE